MEQFEEEEERLREHLRVKHKYSHDVFFTSTEEAVFQLLVLHLTFHKEIDEETNKPKKTKTGGDHK